MAKRKRRAFSGECKAEVVELVRKSGRSIGAVAKQLDLTETAVRRSVEQAEVDQGRGSPRVLTAAERDELLQLRRRVKQLDMEREIRQKPGLLREGELVKYAFVVVEKAQYPVRLLCRCLGVSRSDYYGWCGRGAQEDERLAVEVAAIFKEKRSRYGCPRVRDELRDRGKPVSRKRVARLMRIQGLRARAGRRRAPRTGTRDRGARSRRRGLGPLLPRPPRVLDEVGLLDATSFMYAEETDLCYRAWRQGFEVHYAAVAEIAHLGGGSSRLASRRNFLELRRSIVRVFHKH